METRNIFIDSSIFIGQNFNYTSTVFVNLIRLTKTGKANLFVTDITLREVKAHIEEDVSKAVKASSKFKKDARVLRNLEESPFKEVFQDIHMANILEALFGQLDSFLAEAGATILSTSEVSNIAVFNKYFDREPPFGDGKKKAEFPDAFTLEALEIWCGQNDERIYVASSDPDLRTYCEKSNRLIFLSNLAEFISLVEFHDQVLSPSVSSLIDENRESVAEAISESFCQQGFWIEDQDGDVNEVGVNDTEIQKILLLEVDQSSAVVQVDVITNFSADLTYDDLDTASYDSEDKVLIPWRKIDKTVEHDVEYTAIVHVSHDIENPEYFNIDSVEIDTGRDLGFAISSDDEWPYK